MVRPSVTIAIPMLNEAFSIGHCLGAIGQQSYPHIVEIIVVDGGSADGSREIAASFPKVRVLANPERDQASGLNIALGEAQGAIFVRVDGHAFLAPDYVEKCVDALDSTHAAMVGGPMRPVGHSRRGRAIAIALASPFGAGPAQFHSGRKSGYVDTVYLGAFRTAEARALGGYAPVAVPNEDAEFAFRLGQRCGVWLDTSIHSTYSPRENYGALARQFFRYGRGRAVTVRRHPRSISPRQLAAPALLLALLLPGRRPILAVYAVALTAAAAQAGRREPTVVPGVVAAMVIMHLCWGTAFWSGLLTPPRAAPVSLLAEGSADPWQRAPCLALPATRD